MAGALLALVGFGFSAYLTWVELFEIDAVCQWCVVSAVLMIRTFEALRNVDAGFDPHPQALELRLVRGRGIPGGRCRSMWI